ncbi:ImmA/IrrE family metallo-endopeptidase [Roseomonas sp. JC162]|uniref:ImmA/IrrE family metallo-endopeptidase n=1 Tax=Neoroseomonas marina TaxID=1232220 RepID=A0A848EBG1_9PROT|nr:XRE family transcriptional regulator [Neoroseomonas marina]NMJ40877.1 ImmA/IrrE family metallo-endopeptidase [Neoroseomonas marina]
MLDAAALGRRLRAARESRSITQQAAADTLHIPRTALTNIEAGTRSVSTLELTQLANLYGFAPAALLSDKESNTEDLSVVLPRALPEFSGSPAFKAHVERLVDLCQEGARLRSLLELRREPKIPNYAAPVGSAADAIRQAEEVAGEERRRLGLGNAPLGSLAELVSAEGVWVAETEFGPHSDMSGLFMNHPDIGLAILVNAGHSDVRRRFSYAHEYAHALFDRGETVSATRGANASALMEKRANAFAAAYLMPADGVFEQLRLLNKGNPSRLTQAIFDVANNAMSDTEIRPPAGSQTITYQDVALIARHFRVSYEAAAWRLRSLNRLSQSEAQSLVAQKEVGNQYLKMLDFDELLDNGSPKESNKVGREKELRSQIVHLAIEAFRREEISVGRLREIAAKLLLNVEDLVDLAEAARSDD